MSIPESEVKVIIHQTTRDFSRRVLFFTHGILKSKTSPAYRQASNFKISKSIISNLQWHYLCHTNSRV